MIKLPKHNLDRQNAIIDAQNKVGPYKNYLNDVLRPAIECGDWDKFETLDIGFTVTGESLGKIGDNKAWRELQSFFEPNAIKTNSINFLLDEKVIERNLRNQLKALVLKMMWLSPKDYSFLCFYNTVTNFKKFITPLLSEGYNSFESLDFDRLETWVLNDLTDIDFERPRIYAALNKLYTEAKGLPFEVALTKKLTPSDFGLSFKENKQYTVIPQRLYYLGLQKSEVLINDLYLNRDEVGKLSDYIATYFDKVYQEYAKYLVIKKSKLKNGNTQWYLRKGGKGRERVIAFQTAFLALSSPTEAKTIELLNKYGPEIRNEHIVKFNPVRTLRVGNRIVTSIREAQSLFKEFNGGCLWGLMSRTGMRADEIFHLHTANGWTEETISKQTIYVIHADLSKTTKGSQSKQDEFVTT
jgi:hypothetical protein